MRYVSFKLFYSAEIIEMTNIEIMTSFTIVKRLCACVLPQSHVNHAFA